MGDRVSSETDFDFWIGSWDCAWEGGSGRNTISREFGGHVLVERFEAHPPETLLGSSFTVFSPALARWQQTWVDNQGSYWHFLGGPQGDEVILATVEHEDGRDIGKRMVFGNVAAEGFDWRWERSEDDGVTWTEVWAIRYTRAHAENLGVSGAGSSPSGISKQN
jgi:hypothetical protein